MTKAARQQEQEDQECFFITPIGTPGSSERRRADFVFKMVIVPAAAEVGLRASRADMTTASAMIGTNIFKSVSEAKICVADLTGGNENVFYEMGVRHCLAKPIVHIAQEDTKLPFDNAPHLTRFYDLHDIWSLEGLKVSLASQFSEMMSDSYAVSNPFTQALGNIRLQESGDSRDQVIGDLVVRLERLEKLRPSKEERAYNFPDRRSSHDAINYVNFLIDQLGGPKGEQVLSAVDRDVLNIVISGIEKDGVVKIRALRKQLTKFDRSPIASVMIALLDARTMELGATPGALD